MRRERLSKANKKQMFNFTHKLTNGNTKRKTKTTIPIDPIDGCP